jgi:hypothetical protein
MWGTVKSSFSEASCHGKKYLIWKVEGVNKANRLKKFTYYPGQL